MTWVEVEVKKTYEDAKKAFKLPLTTVIEGELADYSDGGQLETVQAQANKTANMMTRLIETLVKAHLIDRDELNFILYGPEQQSSRAEHVVNVVTNS